MEREEVAGKIVSLTVGRHRNDLSRVCRQALGSRATSTEQPCSRWLSATRSNKRPSSVGRSTKFGEGFS
eukprot:scaffold26465_cov59-Phaeocystis_antarctica.AAC.7